ncbi:MAG TPA: septal ring lytic transglycosylase RlpA family protein [Microvirga sp.]|nr:septal ring lytic transglycosylase RlpA family protein [Microvirga sp.]
MAARAVGVAALALGVANCSQPKVGSTWDSKYGVHASPRVVRDGEPIPKGGGRDLVGKPYVVAGRTYVPRDNPNYAAVGLASWYGADFHGRLTANGEIFDRYAIAAAHTTMPIPSYARVTNLENGRSIVVRVNDRGPYHGNRVIDVSERTAEALDFRRKGTAQVRVEYIRRASPNGSDDNILLSSLRTDGSPAKLPGVTSTMMASAEPRADAPRQTLAFRSFEPSPVAEAAPAPLGPASEVHAGRPVAVPLPPSRPSDLRDLPNPSKPDRFSAGPSAAAPSRPAMAGLSLGPREAPANRN